MTALTLTPSQFGGSVLCRGLLTIGILLAVRRYEATGRVRNHRASDPEWARNGRRLRIMGPMDVFHLMRIGLHGIALVLGSLGIFCLYWSCIGVPVAADALMFLTTATAITLAVDTEKRLRH